MGIRCSIIISIILFKLIRHEGGFEQGGYEEVPVITEDQEELELVQSYLSDIDMKLLSDIFNAEFMPSDDPEFNIGKSSWDDPTQIRMLALYHSRKAERYWKAAHSPYEQNQPRSRSKVSSLLKKSQIEYSIAEDKLKILPANQRILPDFDEIKRLVERVIPR